MKVSCMSEGTIWMSAMDRHDQSLAIWAVPPADGALQQRAGVPQAVVDGRDGAAVLRVAQLGEQHRRAHLGQAVAEAKQEAAGEQHCAAGRRRSATTPILCTAQQ